jgi:hypothetical protein
LETGFKNRNVFPDIQHHWTSFELKSILKIYFKKENIFDDVCYSCPVVFEVMVVWDSWEVELLEFEVGRWGGMSRGARGLSSTLISLSQRVLVGWQPSSGNQVQASGNQVQASGIFKTLMRGWSDVGRGVLSHLLYGLAPLPYIILYNETQ